MVQHRLKDPALDLAQTSGRPDWVAGMFMLFRASDFRQLGGFDDGFFLYYEDVDLCVRVWKSGKRIVLVESASAMHDARRQSHRNL